jgi:hypothetical protein
LLAATLILIFINCLKGISLMSGCHHPVYKHFYKFIMTIWAKAL